MDTDCCLVETSSESESEELDAEDQDVRPGKECSDEQHTYSKKLKAQRDGISDLKDYVETNKESFLAVSERSSFCVYKTPQNNFENLINVIEMVKKLSFYQVWTY